MTTAHFIHGFNVRDGGSNTVGKLAPYFALSGFDVVNHDFGWKFLFLLRRKNRAAVRQLLDTVADGDVLVLHSNAGLLGWMLTVEMARRRTAPGLVICIQPALRRDTDWPPSVKVLCLYNKRDWVVELGRIWGRFASVARPWRARHGWGSAGRHGFSSVSPNIASWDTGVPPVPATGHSGIFQTEQHLYWGLRLVLYARDVTAAPRA